MPPLPKKEKKNFTERGIIMLTAQSSMGNTVIMEVEIAVLLSVFISCPLPDSISVKLPDS